MESWDRSFQYSTSGRRVSQFKYLKLVYASAKDAVQVPDDARLYLNTVCHSFISIRNVKLRWLCRMHLYQLFCAAYKVLGNLIH